MLIAFCVFTFEIKRICNQLSSQHHHHQHQISVRNRNMTTHLAEKWFRHKMPRFYDCSPKWAENETFHYLLSLISRSPVCLLRGDNLLLCKGKLCNKEPLPCENKTTEASSTGSSKIYYNFLIYNFLILKILCLTQWCRIPLFFLLSSSSKEIFSLRVSFQKEQLRHCDEDESLAHALEAREWYRVEKAIKYHVYAIIQNLNYCFRYIECLKFVFWRIVFRGPPENTNERKRKFWRFLWEVIFAIWFELGVTL